MRPATDREIQFHCNTKYQSFAVSSLLVIVVSLISNRV
jgi:hypothetical protein